MRAMSFAAALAALSFAVPAGAATFVSGAGGTTGIYADDFYNFSTSIIPTDALTAYTFTMDVMEDLYVTGFGVSGTGPAADLAKITFNLDFLAPPPQSFTPGAVPTSGTGGFASFFAPAGSTFSLTFFEGAIKSGANVTAFFTTVAADVPVPASVTLLVAGLGAFAVAARARKQNA